MLNHPAPAPQCPAPPLAPAPAPQDGESPPWDDWEETPGYLIWLENQAERLGLNDLAD